MTYSYSQYPASTQVLGLRIFLTQPGRSLNAGYSWPGVFLLGASGRTGRFFTQLLFHNPHSTTIRQIHLVWQWKKKHQKQKTKTKEYWPFQQIGVIHALVKTGPWYSQQEWIYSHAIFFIWGLPVVFVFPD